MVGKCEVVHVGVLLNIQFDDTDTTLGKAGSVS